jgi:hypothetical protein
MGRATTSGRSRLDPEKCDIFDPLDRPQGGNLAAERSTGLARSAAAGQG